MEDSFLWNVRGKAWNWTQPHSLVFYPRAHGSKGVPLAAADGAMKFRDMPDDSGKQGRKISRPRKQAADAGLDQWLSKRLHDVYDPVLNENIPDDLARLLEDFAKRPDGKTD